MKKPPKILEIKEWLEKKNPLGLFIGKKFFVRDIDPKPWSGHFNYLVRSNNRKFVLRFKGPEWGEPTQGILDESKILQYIERYKVGPRVFYLTKNFFGEPMMFEEYLEGKTFTALPRNKQKKLFSAVSSFMARINKIPFRKNFLSFRKPMLSYGKNKETWRKRLKIILKNSRARHWGEKIEKLLPAAEKMLESFEPRLQRVLKKTGSAFIFESAHAGHLMVTKNGFRFLNWEQVSYGDPSYSLAIFLASISGRKDFSQIKEKMIRAYLKENPVPEFKKLVEQRLCEREISNLIWVLWTYVNRGDTRPVEKSTSVAERYKRVASFRRHPLVAL